MDGAADVAIENAIRDLKYGVGLNHLPSGRFAANGAWLAVQTMAHNLARWTARIGLGERIATTKPTSTKRDSGSNPPPQAADDNKRRKPSTAMVLSRGSGRFR